MARQTVLRLGKGERGDTRIVDMDAVPSTQLGGDSHAVGVENGRPRV